MIVSDLMTKDPVCAAADTSIYEVMQRMSEEEIRHIPILDRGELVGVISDRDLRVFSTDLLAEPASAKSALSGPVSRLMSGDVLAVEQDAELSEAVELLLEHRLGALPVTDGADGKVVGILSYVDVLRGVVDKL